MTAKSKPFAGYVRVSRVAGRGGDSFISPEVQRETIEKLAALKGVELAEIVEELDVSGGKAAEERELGKLLTKIDSGEYGGLLVWKVSRYSRNLADGAINADRIRKAGGQLIGEDLDTSQPMGRAILGFLLGWAEEERDQRSAGWRIAQEKAAERGTFPGRAPLGYTKTVGGGLVPDEHASAVTELFAMRARGASLAECRKHLLAATGRQASRAALSNTFRNETYLGHIVLGTIRQEDKHEALTDPTTFARCQGRSRQPRNGSIASQGVLAGFVRCASCGSIMSVTASGKGEKRRASYSCRGNEGKCTAPASILIDVIDPMVTPRIDEYKQTANGSLKDMLRDNEAVAFALGAARKELDAYLEAVSVADVGKEAYLKGLVARRDKVEQLESEWQDSEARADALLDVAEGENAELLHDRAIVREVCESITVSAIPVVDGKKQRKTPAQDRVTITWK